MPNKVKNNNITASTHAPAKDTLPSGNKSVSKAAALSPALNPPEQNNAANLSTKKVTYTNPFSSFLNFILRLLGLLSSKKEPSLPVAAEPIAKTPEISSEPSTPKNAQTKTQTGVHAKEITQLYHDQLLQLLKGHFSEEKANAIFHKIYPAFNKDLKKRLKKTTDLEALRKPLFDLAKKLVAEAVDALTPKEKENVPIAAQAKAINPEIAKVNQALQEISIKLTQGALALDRKTIFQKYPGLEKTLAEMPEQKKQFEMILSRTWVKNALKNLSPYQGTPFEITILKSLGYNVSSYDDKKFLQEALETCFNTKNLPSIEELPKEFKKRAFDFRARLAGVPKEALGNLRALLRFYQAENLKLLEKALEARDGLKLQCRLPKAQDYIKGQFLSLTLVEIRQSLTQFIESRKEALRQGLTSGHQDFPSLSFKVRKELPQNLRGGDAWFYKYENMIIGEFAQGDNENECLTEGACLGLAYRLACAALKAPMDAILGIAVRSIKATDRLIQAYHNNTLAAILPKEVLAKRKQKEKLVFRAKGDTNVGVGLIEHLQKLEESNGGIMLCWDGHATFMRFDPKRNKFFFFDPNFNTIVFQKKHDESLEMLAIRMVTAYIGLYRWSYPTRGLMTAYQIVPLKADETVQTDLNKIPTYVD